MKNDTAVIPQIRHRTQPCSLAWQDDGRILSAQADLANMYLNEPALHGWNRSLTFDRSQNLLTVHDSFSLEPSTISAVWQLNVPVRPVVDGNSIRVGDLVITPLDSPVQINSLEWSAVDAAEYYSGWKIELTRPDGAQEFNVRIRVNASSTWTVANEKGSGPADLGMSLQASPNPFNPAATIVYNVGAIHELPLHLSIYDAAGRCVATLAHGLHQPGKHSVTWNARDFGTGLYFAWLQAGEKTLTRKLILVK
jgi:hypothetical protein